MNTISAHQVIPLGDGFTRVVANESRELGVQIGAGIALGV